MFTKNAYLAFSGFKTMGGSSSSGYNVTIDGEESFKATDGTNSTNIKSQDGQIVAFWNILSLCGAYNYVNTTVTDNSALVLNLTTTSNEISETDYEIISAGNINSYCTIQRNNNKLFITVNNSSANDISFNLVQAFSRAKIDSNTIKMFLWAEFKIPTVTLAPNETKVFVLQKEMIVEE